MVATTAITAAQVAIHMVATITAHVLAVTTTILATTVALLLAQVRTAVQVRQHVVPALAALVKVAMAVAVIADNIDE